MKNLFTFAFALLGMLLTTAAFGQDFPGLDKSPMDAAYFPQRAAFSAFADTEEEKMALAPVIRVLYSRPQKNDRDVFPEVVKYGEVWRVGANEATEIMFYKHVRLGEQLIPAGRYSLYAVPTAEAWTIHISTDLDTWGAYGFKPENSTVATLEVPVQETEATIEALSILFEDVDDGAHMIIAWDDAMVRVPFVF